MRIGIVAAPFIPVPPTRYGGTELFIANLGSGLHARGHEVTVYANGDSRIPCELKWRYSHAQWPIADAGAAQLRNADHTAWAMRDAAATVDVLHLNDVVGVPMTGLIDLPVVLTMHHAHEPALSEIYARYPRIEYVAISASQARREMMPRTQVVHHGLPIETYRYRTDKDDYVAFLGRMAPCKGAHLAIEAARRAGIRLKLAGEVQPVFRDYWDREVRPRIDGRDVEYVGEADRELKNELLSRARALLFPIQWDEPFGLVMVEAMACGTPVLAFGRGSVAEVVRDGVSGWICADVADMARRCASPGVPTESCRTWATEHFSCERMVDRYVEIYSQASSRASVEAGGEAETEGAEAAGGEGAGTPAGNWRNGLPLRRQSDRGCTGQAARGLR